MAEVSKELQRAVKFYHKLRENAREATNRVNREKTTLKRLFKEFYQSNNFPAGTKVAVEGELFYYAAAESEVIPAEKWYKLFTEGKISEEQFLAGIRVSKAEAERSAGADIVLTITEKKTGQKADIRQESTDIEGTKIILPEPKKAASKLRRKGRRVKLSSLQTSAKTKQRVKVGK